MGPDGRPMGIPNVPVTPSTPQISGNAGFNVPPPTVPPPYAYNSVSAGQPYSQVSLRLRFSRFVKIPI